MVNRIAPWLRGDLLYMTTSWAWESSLWYWIWYSYERLKLRGKWIGARFEFSNQLTLIVSFTSYEKWVQREKSTLCLLTHLPKLGVQVHNTGLGKVHNWVEVPDSPWREVLPWPIVLWNMLFDALGRDPWLPWHEALQCYAKDNADWQFVQFLRLHGGSQGSQHELRASSAASCSLPYFMGGLYPRHQKFVPRWKERVGSGC